MSKREEQPKKESQIRDASINGKTISQPLVTKDFNARFFDVSKPTYNTYMYKQPYIPQAEYPYKSNANNASGQNANWTTAAGVPSIVAKISERDVGRVRNIKRPEFLKTNINNPSRNASPHRVFTYKKHVTLDNTARGPLSSY